MTGIDPEERLRRLAAESLAADDPTGWFERAYAGCEDDTAVVPWDLPTPQRLLVEWAEARDLNGAGRRALVVGCGLGRDAEYVARLGFDTVAFDISETAVRVARQRYPNSPVQYLTADLLDPPSDWREAFDLVVESITVQALPQQVRRDAIVQVGQLVASGGTLIVIAAARDEEDVPVEGPPWPLTRAEVESFGVGHLEPVLIEDIRDVPEPGDRRWRAEFRRPEPASCDGVGP